MLRSVLFCAVLAVAEWCNAQIFIEQVFPPSIKRGEVTQVHVIGSDLEGATGLWTTLDQPHVTTTQVGESSTESVLFEITASADAPLGLYGLRLATKNGLSNVHIFAIDDLKSVEESETTDDADNGQLQQAQVVSLPVSVAGVCDNTDVDHFAIDVEANEPVTFEVVGNRLGKGFDPVLTILDEQGKYITARDNDSGLLFDCRFKHQFERAGRYYVRLHDSRYQGSEHWTYVLRMGRFPVTSVAIPSTGQPRATVDIDLPQEDCGPVGVAFPVMVSRERFYFDWRGENDNASVWLPLAVSALANVIEEEPNGSLEQANSIALPCNICGMMNQDNDWDMYALELKKGQRLQLRTDTRDAGSAADLELTLYSPEGKPLRTVDDVGFDDAKFEFAVPNDGRHVLKVVDVIRKGGPAFVYRIEIKERRPDFSLTSEVGRLAIPSGNWQPLPLELKRVDFGGPVELSLVGVPSGVTLRETTIAKGVNELVAELAVDQSVAPAIYTLQVAAESLAADDDKPIIKTFARTQPLVDRVPTGRGPHGEPFELREDQRRIPPSLTDRIALVVLPPSPYDFNITTPTVTLPRYMKAKFTIETTRIDGYDWPITLEARGGQLEQDRLRPPRIQSEIPIATTDNLDLIGTLQSRVNTQTQLQRVTVTGTAEHDGRKIHLTRTFQLDVKTAFAPSAEPEKLELRAGESSTVKLRANRLGTYDDQVEVMFGKSEGIEYPEIVTIPGNESAVDLELKTLPDLKPGKYKISVKGSGKVGKFFEEASGGKLEVVIVEATEN